MKSPSEKQVSIAEKISNVLQIDFPICSKQYTAQAYWEFINENMVAFKEATTYVPDEDDLMWACGNDVWCEHY